MLFPPPHQVDEKWFLEVEEKNTFMLYINIYIQYMNRQSLKFHMGRSGKKYLERLLLRDVIMKIRLRNTAVFY